MKKKNKLAPRLKRARLNLGLTIRQVSSATNGRVCNPYISKLENGVMCNPSPRVLWYLSKVYREDYHELMRLAGYMMRGEGQ